MLKLPPSSHFPCQSLAGEDLQGNGGRDQEHRFIKIVTLRFLNFRIRKLKARVNGPWYSRHNLRKDVQESSCFLSSLVCGPL